MKKRLFINLFASLFSFFLQIIINFLLTPFLVKRLGAEAYGFIGLANNFVAYASILTVAINSMANRFISIEYSKNNIEKANKYYVATLVANIIISIIIFICTVILIVNLSNIIKIPENLILDVKLTFLIVFINLIISLFMSVYSIVPFVKNRIDRLSVIQIFSNIIKVIFLVVVFVNFKAKIYYIALAALLYSVLNLILNIITSKKMCRELNMQIRTFEIKDIKKIAGSGIWNSINKLGNILLVGMDLLVTNIFLGPYSMGIISISKVLPTSFESLLFTIGNVFFPQFTIVYSKNDKKELIKEVNFSMKVLSLIIIVPVAGFIVLGKEFYALWLNGNNEINKLYWLSIISLLPFIFSSVIYTLHYLDNVTNKLKRPVFVNIFIGALSFILMIVFVKTTDLGVYAVVLSSAIPWTLKIIIFTPINAALNINSNWKTFYPQFIKAIATLGLIIVLFFIFKPIFVINTWGSLIVVSLIFAIVGYILVFIILLDKYERKKIRMNFINKVLHMTK